MGLEKTKIRRGLVDSISVIILTWIAIEIQECWTGFACLRNPCIHGICIDELNSTHQCYCVNGFTAMDCSINWDECNVQPCQNGGTCNDGIASFNCSCGENFAGTLCEYDLSNCEDFISCRNNGTCSFDPGLITLGKNGSGFYCACESGFYGVHCELDLSVCNSTQNVCLNGGKCIDGVGNKFECLCQPGWIGENCQIEIDECSSGPCENGGICIDQVNGFNCACPFGFTGNACQFKLQICVENPCKNNGFCLEENGSPTCYCVPDFHGKLCEEQYNECEPGPKCFNGGKCKDGVGGFNCSCTKGYFGSLCQCTEDEYNSTDPACQQPPTNDTITESYPPFRTSTLTMIYPTFTLSLIPIPTEVEETEQISPTPTSITDFIESTETIQVQLTPTATFVTTVISSSLEFDFSTDIIITESEVELSPTLAVSPSPTDSDMIEESMTQGYTSILQPTILISSTVDWVPTPDPSSYDYFTTVFSTTMEYEYPTPSPTIPDETSIFPPDETSIDYETVSWTTTQTPYPQPEPTATVTYPSENVTSPFTTEQITETPMDNGTITTPRSSTNSHITAAPIDNVTTTDVSKTESVVTNESPESPGNSTITQEPRSTDRGIIVTARPLISTPSEETIPASTTQEGSSITISEEPLISTEITPITSESQLTTLEDGFLTSVSYSQRTTTDDAESTSPSDRRVSSSSTGESEISETPETSTFRREPMTTEFSKSSVATSSETLLTTLSESPWINGSIITSEEDLSTSWTTVGTLETESGTYESSTSSDGSTTIAIVDPCLNYCQNSAKCILITLEPICICQFKFRGKRCEIRSEKIKVPAFRGNSFLRYTLVNESKSAMDVSLQLATIVSDGVLLHMASSLESSVDGLVRTNRSGRSYALIFLQNGHVVLHFSCGSQSMEFVETRTRVNNGYNFTLDLAVEVKVQVHGNRTDIYCLGKLSVNGSSFVMSGEQLVRRGNFPLFESVYIGGVEPRISSGNMTESLGSDVLTFVPGLRGCIYTVSINNKEIDIYDEAMDGREVGECETFACLTNPCFGNSKCIPSTRPPFWECICPIGFDGFRCQIKVCTQNPCQNGATCSQSRRLLNSTLHNELTCLCPLGFSGKSCENRINVTKPSFHPTEDFASYISYYGLPRLDDWFQMKFHFVTLNMTQIALLLYIGNQNYAKSISISSDSEQIENPLESDLGDKSHDLVLESWTTAPDFFSLTFLQGFLAVTWNLGSGTQRIFTPSKIDPRLQIHTIYFGREGRQAWLKVDGMRNMTGKSPGPMYRLNVEGDLFIGGFESYHHEGLPHDLTLHAGFQGCVFDLGVRLRNKLFLPKPFKARNVKNCFEDC